LASSRFASSPTCLAPARSPGSLPAANFLESWFCRALALSATVRHSRHWRSRSRIWSTGASSPLRSAARRTASGSFRISSSGSTSALATQVREEEHVADRGLVGHEHHQPIHAHPEAAGRRHPLLEGGDVVLVHRVGLAGARAGGGDLGLEA